MSSQTYKINDIKTICLGNKDFRKILATFKNLQIVVMSLKKDGFIDTEVHKHNDQLFYVHKGSARVILNGNKKYTINKDDVFIVPANTEHKIECTCPSLKLLTIYTPPVHDESNYIHKFKQSGGNNTEIIVVSPSHVITNNEENNDDKYLELEKPKQVCEDVLKKVTKKYKKYKSKYIQCRNQYISLLQKMNLQEEIII